MSADHSAASGPDTGPALRSVEFGPADELLREDVNQLGALVGAILADQRGQPFLDEVEALRRLAVRRREDRAPVDVLVDALADRPVDGAADLVRAFSTYFQAVNLAERVHRIRRRRDHERAEHGVQPEGLHDVVGRLQEDGVDAAGLGALLERMRIEPVFTAHPTEAVRRVLLHKERQVVQALLADLDRTLTPPERQQARERIRVALTASWQTAEAPSAKPSVADEFEHVGFYLSEVLYRVLPDFLEVFADAVRARYPGVAVPDAVLGFGSWVGGDMDGNPNVGADTIADTLATQRGLVLEAYRRDLAPLADLLSQSLGRVEVDAALLARLAEYRTLLPGAAAGLHPRHVDMPYRNLLLLMDERLRLTADDAAGGYPEAAAFVADLELLLASLRDNRGANAGCHAVQRVLRRARCFGFHLASLDLRQESSAHDAALAALLGEDDWAGRDVDTRATTLRALIDGTQAPADPAAPGAAPTLEVFRTVAALRPRYGERVFGPYIVSMSRSAADALAVLALARIAGCVEGGQVPLDVAPLFETVDDLDAAADTLRALFGDPEYRAHLEARGNRQVVMLGYSDSAKDGGIVASRWALQRTQRALLELARESGVRIAFFHGRGGSISRGGGKTGRAVIAGPRGSVDGYLRLTEQGEVIHRKYGIRAIALRNLEQTTSAVLRASLRPRPADGREQAWSRIADRLAGDARRHYRTLVHEHPDFPAYFRAATPIEVIERLRIGSRPSKRGGSGDVDALRAIPWVFSWAQNRSGLTAWYGVGTALERAIDAHGLDALATMARDWPFFGTLIDDVEMVLAKSDPGIFERYSLLAAALPQGDLHARLHPGIAAEFRRTVEAVLAIKGAGELLEGDPKLARSIRLRNPYVDPISLLQVDLLARWRAEGRPDDERLHALMATVNGIAAGIQNTG
ncbi:phosphoenolpyruvate carboxylase [Lysobacter sp. GX 14042]|uniref:phosphoenolpyruvate carboxylase n=1 Tax=Lysobacter sp. GX 14042 TaxID=2907155 RepID=UPI001F1A0244|nr:phosphoenolpyruvate carboxylase [Lysobacter sp. GX 14042]MCE7033454.1 phosphoenolpyruvate carboxylase [Lysobacter sp. GX 14042]